MCICVCVVRACLFRHVLSTISNSNASPTWEDWKKAKFCTFGGNSPIRRRGLSVRHVLSAECHPDKYNARQETERETERSQTCSNRVGRGDGVGIGHSDASLISDIIHTLGLFFWGIYVFFELWRQILLRFYVHLGTKIENLLTMDLISFSMLHERGSKYTWNHNYVLPECQELQLFEIHMWQPQTLYIDLSWLVGTSRLWRFCESALQTAETPDYLYSSWRI